MNAEKSILVINGPNLNKLGSRELNIYGDQTLEDIRLSLSSLASLETIDLIFFQSNSESEIIDEIHEAERKGVKGILINAAAFTHTSIAIRDALLALSDVFIVEVHLSNIFKREKFRHQSYISDISDALIAGMGSQGYEYGFKFIMGKINGST